MQPKHKSTSRNSSSTAARPAAEVYVSAGAILGATAGTAAMVGAHDAIAGGVQDAREAVASLLHGEAEEVAPELVAEVTPDEPVQAEAVAEVEVETLPADRITVAAGITDDMTFAEAFSAARAELGAGGTFTWRGGVYNTYTEQEWHSHSSDEHLQFAQRVSGGEEEPDVLGFPDDLGEMDDDPSDFA